VEDARAADFDGDGIEDVALATDDGEVVLLFGNGL